MSQLRALKSGAKPRPSLYDEEADHAMALKRKDCYSRQQNLEYMALLMGRQERLLINGMVCIPCSLQWARFCLFEI